MIGNQVGGGGGGGGVGVAVVSTVVIPLPSLSCRTASTVMSTVRAWDVALLSIMSIIRGPIFISAVSLPVAIFASASAVSFACAVLFCGRSRHTLFRRRAVQPVDRSYGPTCLTYRRRCTRRSDWRDVEREWKLFSL